MAASPARQIGVIPILNSNLIGGPGFEPGPHAPESDAHASSHAAFRGFQLETSQRLAYLRLDLTLFSGGLLPELLHGSLVNLRP